MLQKKKILDSKVSSNSTVKKNLTKSISLLLNTSNISSNNLSKRLQPNIVKKSNSVDKIGKKNVKHKNNNKKSSNIYNVNLQRQNSQGALYSMKNYINDTQITNNNLKYQRLNSHLLSETKTPKLIELLNNKIKRKRNYLETYNNNNINKVNNYNKSKAALSLAHKKKNLSQGNMDYINFDEYYNYNIFKSSRNQKMIKKQTKDNTKDFYNKTHKNKYDRYDKNKCVIERKIYAGEKKIKKTNDEKNVEIKTLPNNCESIYNKILFNNIKLNINKELNLNALKKTDTKVTNNNNNKEIQLIFPSFNKFDINNESSQESTNQIASTYSNKMTINNINIGYRKDKFISSFLDGPEDIHYRFVELHKQRKMFYENLCNKLEENGNNINVNNQNVNDFDISEYSEYFDNYNEDVPLI